MCQRRHGESLLPLTTRWLPDVSRGLSPSPDRQGQKAVGDRARLAVQLSQDHVQMNGDARKIRKPAVELELGMSLEDGFHDLPGLKTLVCAPLIGHDLRLRQALDPFPKTGTKEPGSAIPLHDPVFQIHPLAH